MHFYIGLDTSGEQDLYIFTQVRQTGRHNLCIFTQVRQTGRHNLCIFTQVRQPGRHNLFIFTQVRQLGRHNHMHIYAGPAAWSAQSHAQFIYEFSVVAENTHMHIIYMHVYIYIPQIWKADRACSSSFGLSL